MEAQASQVSGRGQRAHAVRRIAHSLCPVQHIHKEITMTKMEIKNLKKQLIPGAIIKVRLSALKGAKQSRSKKATAVCVVAQGIWFHKAVRRYYLRVCAPMNYNSYRGSYEYSIEPSDVIEITGANISQITTFKTENTMPKFTTNVKQMLKALADAKIEVDYHSGSAIMLKARRTNISVCYNTTIGGFIVKQYDHVADTPHFSETLHTPSAVIHYLKTG